MKKVVFLCVAAVLGRARAEHMAFRPFFIFIKNLIGGGK